jgi:thiaminase/transcriptional activator TenA
VPTVPVADLVSRHASAWSAATRHRFLTGVRDGTVPRWAFEAWLVQDYRYVCDLLSFQARLLARAPRQAQPVLAGGLVALVDELDWFEQQVATLAIELDAAPRLATRAYAELLVRLDEHPVAVALTALWVLERVYLEAWSFAAPGDPAYREFVAHWTTAPFAAYVDALEQAADSALAAESSPDLDPVVAAVLDAETRFWDTALDDPASDGAR